VDRASKPSLIGWRWEKKAPGEAPQITRRTASIPAMKRFAGARSHSGLRPALEDPLGNPARGGKKFMKGPTQPKGLTRSLNSWGGLDGENA